MIRDRTVPTIVGTGLLVVALVFGDVALGIEPTLWGPILRQYIVGVAGVITGVGLLVIVTGRLEPLTPVRAYAIPGVVGLAFIGLLGITPGPDMVAVGVGWLLVGAAVAVPIGCAVLRDDRRWTLIGVGACATILGATYWYFGLAVLNPVSFLFWSVPTTLYFFIGVVATPVPDES